MGKWIFLTAYLVVLSACGHFARSPQSGYHSDRNYSVPARTPQNQPPGSFQISRILAELGMSPEDLNTAEGVTKLNNVLEIKKLEAQLSGDRERQQYYKNLPWLRDDKEQLEFLRQNGYFARQTWLRKRGIGKRASEIDNIHEDLIASKDIAVGMPNELVRRSWGSPDAIDVAGNPIYGNERWRYKRYTPSPDGYRLQSRIVYFEAGKVVGWEQVDH